MAEGTSRKSRKSAARPSAGKRGQQPKAAGNLVSGDVYEDYLRGLARAQTLPATIPGTSCPPFTVPAAQCLPGAGAETTAGFPTIPLQHCVRTVPGLNCPVDTVPLIECLPKDAAGATIPVVGCPQTIPGVTCPVATVPFLGCLPDHAEADAGAPLPRLLTVIPPCPTLAGVTCPLPTIPLGRCIPGGRVRTVPVVGCPQTIPGLTCPLPTMPVVACVPQVLAPAPDSAAAAARGALAAPAAAGPFTTITLGGPACQSIVLACPTWPQPITFPGCFTVPPGCGPGPTTLLDCSTATAVCGPEPLGTDALAADRGAAVPFPTIPTESCVRTVPGVNCPVATIPLVECLPIRTLPVVDCPKTIPALICDIETIPIVRCIGDEVPGDLTIRTIVPPCPTVPGVTCPVRTIPVITCMPGAEALADAKDDERAAAATLPVIGCPPTIPGVTCGLPTVPVLGCLGGSTAAPQAARTLAPTCPAGIAAPAPTEPPGCAAIAGPAPTQPPGCAAVAGLAEAAFPTWTFPVVCPIRTLLGCPPFTFVFVCPITLPLGCPFPAEAVAPQPGAVAISVVQGCGPPAAAWQTQVCDPIAAARLGVAAGPGVEPQAFDTLLKCLFSLICLTVAIPCPSINAPCPSAVAVCPLTLLRLCPDVPPEEPDRFAAAARVTMNCLGAAPQGVVPTIFGPWCWRTGAVPPTIYEYYCNW